MKTLNEQIERVKELLRKCYGVVVSKGGEIPEAGERNMENLPNAIDGIKSLKQEDLDAAWDAFKGNTGMIPKEEQTIGNLKYAVAMNAEEMDVNEINFVDFNGLVLSMTIEEVMQLTEMPKPNEYYNLTFEHWTKTLEEIQDGRCHTVGATYHTTDGLDYYVVKVKAGEQVTINTRVWDENIILYWGDGTSERAYSEISHTYEKEGTYTIHLDAPTSNFLVYSMQNNNAFTEIYLSEKINRENINLRYGANMTKISIPDNGTAFGANIGGFCFNSCNKLKSLIMGNSYIGDNFESWGWASINLPSLEYLVADGVQGLWEPMSHFNLKAFSLKNLQQVGRDGDYLFMNLKYAVFDNLTSISKQCFTTGGTYATNSYTNTIEVVDLPETLTSIANKAFYMGANDVYIRSLTPPTLGGQNVFIRRILGWKTNIHISKDATYTDADGNNWTGLEAYAHATNWSALYANTTYYTFIDDL